MRTVSLATALCVLGACLMPTTSDAAPFQGRYFSGEGDTDYLRLLDTCYQMLYPSPDLQNIGMLYTPAWQGFVEGPTWGAWWIQNSYGPTYCGLPFFQEPYITWVRNAQDLWFSQMGDGKREGGGDWHWVAPDGCLCDAAAPGWIFYKQGDGRVDIHDWGMEFTAAGVVLQTEMLLISRDRAAIAHYLPLLERSANFLESRRDPDNDLFLAGPAGNLLAPSYAGYKRPDGTYDKAYLTGLSVTTIAALDRLIELEKLAGREAQAALYADRRDRARRGLARLTAPGGYLVKYLDPDGTPHGVYGAEKHGYFEAVCNHDAIALRVVDEAQARRIWRTMEAIKGLRPHNLIITNYPSLDDMYTEPTGLWEFGRWVNGGHWTTCEARMMLTYFRLGAYEDARRAMNQLLAFARRFRFDNPLVDFGGEVYQPQEPVNTVYDSWGGPLGMLRGLFEYLYAADELTLIPHIPPDIVYLRQQFPVRFGDKRLFLSTCGTGPVTAVWLNGARWRHYDSAAVTLPYDKLPGETRLIICLGGAEPRFAGTRWPPPLSVPDEDAPFWDVSALTTGMAGNGRPLRLGADSNGGTRFVGDFRRARLFSRALTSEEIARLAADPGGEFADPALVADYLLDRCAGGVCPNPPNPDLPATVVGPLPMVPAGSGQAAHFAGEGYLEVPSDPRLNLTAAYTLEAWVCPGELPASGGRLIDRVTAGVDDGYLLDTFPGNGLRFITEQGHAGYAARLVPGEWVHVAATFAEMEGLRLYLNGALVASAPASRPATTLALARVGCFYVHMEAAGLGDTFEAQQARLAVEHLRAFRQRVDQIQAGTLPPLPGPSGPAADRLYLDTATKLADGLAQLMHSYETSLDPAHQRVLRVWREAAEGQ